MVYVSVSDNHINNANKLGILKEVMGEYRLPKYLYFIRNPSWRKSFTSWRLSCHKLPIETGRHLNIPRPERKCTKCNLGVLGDEVHALFVCDNDELNKTRITYLDQIIIKSPQFQRLSHNDRLLYKIMI